MIICILSLILDGFDQFNDLISLGILFLLLLELVVRWTVAVETPHQIVHDRKTGLIELLMVSPLSDKSIVSGLIKNLKQFQFNRSLLLSISYLAFILSIVLNQNYSLSWSTDTPMVHFVCFIGSVFWIYLGLRLELVGSNAKRFLLIIIAQTSLLGPYFLILVNFNSSSISIYSTYFYHGTIIYLFLAGIIFLSFFGLRYELKPLRSVKFSFLMIGHLFFIIILSSDFYFYDDYKYSFGNIIILLAFIGGSLYITYCILQSNGNRLQPNRIVLLMIAHLSIAGGFYYLMATSLLFNDRQSTEGYFWLSCGTIILLFWGL